jgi:hypothetical protein
MHVHSPIYIGIERIRIVAETAYIIVATQAISSSALNNFPLFEASCLFRLVKLKLITGFNLAVDIKVEGIDEEVLKVAHEVCDVYASRGYT